MEIYLDTKFGDESIIFLHGWCCDHTSWVNQVEFFRERYRVVVVDWLKNLSSAECDSPDIFEIICQQLVDFCKANGIEQPIVVAHSLGGALALMFANSGFKVRAVALIDSSTPIVASNKAKYLALAKSLRADDGEKKLEDFFWQRFVGPFDDKETMAQQLLVMQSYDADFAAALIERAVQLPLEKWLRDIPCPVVYIGSSNPMGDYNVVQTLHPGIIIGQVIASGHFVMLNAARQFNAMLQRFFEVIPVSG